MYDEEDFLLLSGIQHFSFCRRQWALIHIEQLWKENLRTVEGHILHERVHDPFFNEKRGDVITVREMRIFSRRLGISGQCDVVEFHRDDVNGISLFGRSGTWSPVPVEYKRGTTKNEDADRLQLTAQAICLEEMLCCAEIAQGYLYYGETKRREAVALTGQLRGEVSKICAEMQEYYRRGYTPRVKMSKACNACSLKDLCLPKLPKAAHSVREYIRLLA
jgi:CRISPR-associated exonuclease Cas4